MLHAKLFILFSPTPETSRLGETKNFANILFLVDMVLHLIRNCVLIRFVTEDTLLKRIVRCIGS